MSAQMSFIIDNLPNLLFGFPGQRPGGLLMSVILAIISVGIGFVLGIFVGASRGSSSRWLQGSSKIFVDIFRGLPLILLIVLVHQVLGGRRFGLDLSPMTAVLISLSLYSGAYQAEIVYSGLKAVPTQIVESARLVGGSAWQVFLKIKLRYALRVMLPAFVGQAISLFKDTSVVLIVAVPDLMTVARSVLGSDVRNLSNWVSLYLFVGLLYFIVAFSFSTLAKRWEQRLQASDLILSLAQS
ncbi:MAG: amino acid ABC transporter permease [Anaerolineales bacterium]|nr:amino acid ABC transporter permease [Chloroflexota bacterium]MBL6983845.1 amino acid ABC transporter permease [Anaerolineales bacterium]